MEQTKLHRALRNAQELKTICENSTPEHWNDILQIPKYSKWMTAIKKFCQEKTVLV